MKNLLPLLLALVVLGCRPASDDSSEPMADAADQAATGTEAEVDRPSDSATASDSASSVEGRLEAILETQPEDVRARFDSRHPRETLEFFGIEPGMTVVEGLPGGGWYTKILLPYLGSEGELIAGNYPLDL